MKTIRIIAAGGTFDKRYNPLNGQLEFGSTHLEQLIQDARLNQSPTLQVAMQIDSLDMTDTHRATLLGCCQSAPESAIVLIHGTDTMTNTALVLGQAELNKTIVLTGAMVPYALEHSDATYNLGFAMGAAQCLPAGVYIAMGGQVFAWDRVAKNREIGKFEG